MEDSEKLLEKYYSGETTTEEERELKAVWKQGKLPGEPIMAFQNTIYSLPPELKEKIQATISQRRQYKYRQIGIITGSIAALLLVFLCLFILLPSQQPDLQLSDNLKKERFEEALRMIGNALEEKTPSIQRVLYEDHNLIIAVE